jgi:hypothetical protein
MGCELAVWSVGLLVLAGLSVREGWRRVLNPAICTLVIAVAVNLAGFRPPTVLMRVIDLVGGCAIPFGLLLCGVTLDTYVKQPRQLYSGRTTPAACLLRLAVLPVAFLLLARFAPVSTELKRVLVIQAAMPSGMMPLVLARHYGGQPLIAAQIIVGTTLLGLFVIPLWLQFGMAWVGDGSLDLGELGRNLDAVRMVALGLGRARPPAEHAVELVDQFIERFLRLVAVHARDQVRSADLDVSLGDKRMARVARLVVLEIEADANDVFLVPEQADGLLPGRGVEGLGEVEMHAADDDSRISWDGVSGGGHDAKVRPAGPGTLPPMSDDVAG